MRRTGAIVVVASLAGFLLLAAVMRSGLRSSSADRFLVTIEAVRSGQPGDAATRRLPRDRPLRVRLGGRPAAGAAQALAILLDGAGALLRGPTAMTAEPDERGRPGFAVDLPPLLGAPGAPEVANPAGGVVVAVAVRLPEAASQAVERLRRAARGAPVRAAGETHEEVFDRILQEARALGGHAEMIAAEVRPRP